MDLLRKSPGTSCILLVVFGKLMHCTCSVMTQCILSDLHNAMIIVMTELEYPKQLIILVQQLSGKYYHFYLNILL